MWLKILLKQWICYFSEVSWGLDTKPNNKFWLGRSWYRRPTMISATIGWTRMHSPFTLILTLQCPHFTTQLPTADQFCSEGWEVSLVEVPACLTVVAMVGGHGQAKKEGANCQVGRCLVFFGMTVALGGVSTAWRRDGRWKQEWWWARWRLGRRLRRRRSRFPALWKKGKAFIDASEIFNRKVWLWQAVCAGLPLLTNATPQKTSHMWALPFWRCNHCFDLLRSHLIFSGRRMSVVLCQDSSQCKVSYMWGKIQASMCQVFLHLLWRAWLRVRRSGNFGPLQIPSKSSVSIDQVITCNKLDWPNDHERGVGKNKWLWYVDMVAWWYWECWLTPARPASKANSALRATDRSLS